MLSLNSWYHVFSDNASEVVVQVSFSFIINHFFAYCNVLMYWDT